MPIIITPQQTFKNMIEELQAFLNQQGYTPKLVVDGDFGSKTKKAVDWFKLHQVKLSKPVAPNANRNEWRLAESLVKLRDEINMRYPFRKKISDGTIGDQDHSSRNSDHNAWVVDKNGEHVVTALDITYDPENGVNCLAIADKILDDPRVKYIIFNKQIWNKSVAARWRFYAGTNPHTKHMHISVHSDQDLYDNKKSWGIK